jgi:serine phosphatase RsbU (regulator of sigma subunit)
VPVAHDETLFLYTDGVIDTLGEDERFGSERLKRLLATHAGQTPDGLLSSLEAELDRFQVGAQADDTAALALRPAPVTACTGRHTTHRAGPSRTLGVS